MECGTHNTDTKKPDCLQWVACVDVCGENVVSVLQKDIGWLVLLHLDNSG